MSEQDQIYVSDLPLSERKTIGDYVMEGGLKGKFFRSQESTDKLHKVTGPLIFELGKSYLVSDFIRSCPDGSSYTRRSSLGLSLTVDFVEATEEEVTAIFQGKTLLSLLLNRIN